jgi:nicotinate-nucleotide adenylyltransferase
VPRVGVFGGSFNPIHFGHLLLADEICEVLALDRLLFVPAAQPPHKPTKDLAPAHDRFQMTALAVREHARFEVCDVELRRSGPSYTVQTLEALRDRGDLHLVMGSETFLDLLDWREPAQIVRLARLVIVPRNGTVFDPETPAVVKVLTELGLPDLLSVTTDGTWPFSSAAEAIPRSPLLVRAASLPISGSDLRRRAREGLSLAYRMPGSVAAYMKDHGLYRDDA